MSFFIREQGKFTTKVYRKPILSGVYSNFERFLASVYKCDVVHTLVYISNLLQLDTIPHRINFSERNIS